MKLILMDFARTYVRKSWPMAEVYEIQRGVARDILSYKECVVSGVLPDETVTYIELADGEYYVFPEDEWILSVG